jgi:hypothetical protein
VTGHFPVSLHPPVRNRHCERNEAISLRGGPGDCRVASLLAMTEGGALPAMTEDGSFLVMTEDGSLLAMTKDGSLLAMAERSSR